MEVELARQCETSRTPVREACTRLGHEGWISQIRYKGYMVPAISVREIIELYEYRKVLECFTAGKVADCVVPSMIHRGPRESSPMPKSRSVTGLIATAKGLLQTPMLGEVGWSFAGL